MPVAKNPMTGGMSKYAGRGGGGGKAKPIARVNRMKKARRVAKKPSPATPMMRRGR